MAFSLLIMLLLMIMFYVCGFCDMMRKINDRIDDLNYQNDIDLETVVKLVNEKTVTNSKKLLDDRAADDFNIIIN